MCEFGAKPKLAQEAHAKELLEKYGDRPRQYRNGLGLAVPSADQIEALRRAVRYLMAIEQVKDKAMQLNLTDEQKGQLREREATERASIESAFLKLYIEVWLPRVEEAGLITVSPPRSSPLSPFRYECGFLYEGKAEPPAMLPRHCDQSRFLQPGQPPVDRV